MFRGVGCIAPLSVTKIREGVIAWLSPLGAFTYNQAVLQDISTERLYNYLAAIPAADWPTAVGYYRRDTWFLSFPSAGVTLTYYFPTGAWNALLYSTPAAVYSPATPVGSSVFEQAVGTVGQSIAYFDYSDSDLGNPISLQWVTNLDTSKAPFGQKTYRSCVVLAPIQPVIVTINLIVDPGYISSPVVWTSPPINLALGPTARVVNITGQSDCKGYAAQVKVTATNNGLVPVEIWKVLIGGSVDRTWTTNA
jgi:hypothetical protein